MKKNNIIKWTIITGLWAILLIPFFVANQMYFPYITGKNFLFRIIVEIIFALWVYLIFIDAKYRPKFSWISVSVGAFVFIMAIADIFAVNPIKAIWSNYERMDGFITLGHLIMYLFVFASIMKTEKNWLWFFRSSVITSSIMIIFVISEWVSKCPNGIKALFHPEILKTCATERISVTLGNPIYVAVFFMFNFFFVLILLYKDVLVKNENAPKFLKTIFRNWLFYVYIIATFICAFGIWRTSTRGVILGLLGGLIITSIIIAIFEKKNKLIKNLSISALIIIILLIGGFFVVKNTQFIQNNVTLKRLADISWTNVAGQGQARQYVWPMALKGFQEKPILGWGQDGFNNIFNKYYDVRMYNQEQWFDRAHNTPLDILIAGGVLGLIFYFLIFVASLFIIIKKKNNFTATEKGLLIGLLSAYFAQNLFVFDNLTSYIFFYIVLAYLYSRDINEDFKNKKVVTNDVSTYIVAPITAVLCIAMLWTINIQPINANTNLIKAMQQFNTPQTKIPFNDSLKTSLIFFKKVFSINTFGNSEAREQIIHMSPYVANANNVDAKTKQEFIDLAYTQMQEQIKETPNDARYQFFMGAFLNNMNQYQLALPYLQKAVELSPKKLTILFELAKNYSYLGQKEKALEINKSAYDLIPEYNEAKMNYVASLILNDQEILAKQIMGTATTTNENIIRMYLIKASAFIQKGDKNSAIIEVKKAMDIAPTFKEQGNNIIKSILEEKVK
ncbi:MAG: O-antigen ligase family protein [bacterium]